MSDVRLLSPAPSSSADSPKRRIRKKRTAASTPLSHGCSSSPELPALDAVTVAVASEATDSAPSSPILRPAEHDRRSPLSSSPPPSSIVPAAATTPSTPSSAAASSCPISASPSPSPPSTSTSPPAAAAAAAAAGSTPASSSPENWTQLQVREWLCSIGLERCANIFDAEGIDGSVLMNLGPLEIQELVPEDSQAHFEQSLKRLLSPSGSPLPPNLGDWTTEHVVQWLRSLGMEPYCDVVQQKRISGFNLYYLTKRIMKEQLGINRLGDRVKLSAELSKLRETFNPDVISVQDIRKRIEQVEMKCELVNVNTDTKQVSLNHKNWLAMKNASSRDRYAPVITFVGPTGCGKSTLLTEFLSISERELKSGPLIAQPGQIQPTTGNIQAFVGEDVIRIYKQRIKVFRSGVEPPSSDTQAYDQELANHEKARKKEFAERMTIVNDRFPQLAYMISDVLVYVDVHPMHDRKYLTRVREFAKRSNQQNASTDKPFLLLVQNKADDLSNLLIKETTERFFIAAKEDPELDSFLSCFRDIYFVKIPHRKHNSEEYCSQVEAFRYLVGCLLTNSPPPGGAALTSHNAAAASSVAPVDEHNNSCGAPSTIVPATATTIATPSTATTTTCGHDSDAGGTVDDVPALAPLPTLAVSPSTALNEAADSLAQDPIDPHFFTEYVWFDVLAEIIKQFPDILSKSEALSKVCRPASDLHEKVFSFFEIMYRPTALLPPSWDRMTEADCRPFLERRRNAFLQARQLSISKLASEIVPGFKQRWGVDSSRHPFFQTVKVVSALRETLEALLSLVEKRQPCLATQGRRCCTQEFMLHADHRCYGHVWKGEPQFDDQPSHEELFCQFFQQVREFTDMSDSEFLQSSLDMLAPLADVEQLRPKCCLLCLSKQNDGLLSCEHAFCRACIDRLVQHYKERESPPKKAALASPSAAAVAAAVAAATLATSRCVLCPLCKKLSPVLDNMDRLPGHAGARVLALDGGGVRGLVLNEIMLCLCSRTNRHPSELFDLIVGTSTGSIIATLWGLIRKPLAECKQLYLSFPSQIFKRRPAHRAIGRTAYTWWNSKPPYKHKDLARELRGFFGASRFIDYADPQYPKVSVVSSVVLDDDDIRTYLFGNYSPSGRVEGIDHPVDYWHGLVEAGCCSSSAPTYFKQMTLGGYKFVDGGLLNNNPTLVAIKEASLIWKDRPLDVVVSLGTGLKRRKIALPKNPSQRHVAQSPPQQPPPLSASSPGGHSWHQHRGDGDVLTSSAEALARPVVWRNAVGQSSLVLASSASSMSMLSSSSSSSSASSAASSLLDLHQAPSSLQHQQQQRKKQKSSKGENGLVLWVERMIELATGTEQQHYQAMRTLPENVPYFRLNPEGLGNYPLDATSQKTLNEICVKTAEWCQEPEQAAELDRLADVLFAKGFYLSGPNVVEAHVDCDSRFFIQSRLHGALSKDSPMFQVTASLWRSILPLDAADDHHARFNSLRSSSASRSLREGHDDPTNSVGLVMKYVESAPAPMIEVKFVASVPGIYHWEVRVQLESGEELPISGQPWEMTVLPMKKQQPADADLLKELSWTSFVLSCKQFADMEHLDSRDLLVHHRRVKERLGLLGLKEQKVPDSANSLFMAVSDQLYGDFSHASAIRKATATWLEANEFWELENGQHICQYVQDQPFRDYCNALLAGTAWGDHLCLVAVAQMFGARLIVVTSVIGDECLLDIEPILKKTERVIRLCHWGSRSFASVSSGVETHYLPTTWSTQPTAAAADDDDDDERPSSAAKSKSRRKSKLRRKESTGQKSHRRKSHAAQLPPDEQQRSKVD